MTKNNEISKLRRAYSLKELSENSVSENPFKQFSDWMNEALKSDFIDPTAMILATANTKGVPSVRTVLLKGFDEKGFVFFTNYESSKAKDLEENPNAALLFYWGELERQIRINGKVEKVSKSESEEYFNSRPHQSQISAWASKQSSAVTNRKTLEEKFEAMKEKFKDKEIPLPPFWGGYRIIPNKFEFWQGRENRLHDRVCYTLNTGIWKIERLSP